MSLKKYSSLPRTVILLSWVSFFADISSEMIYPIMPLFVGTVLGASALSLGLIEGIAQGIVSLMTAFSGIASDQNRKRVPFVRWGYGLPIVGKSLLSLASTWPLFLLGRCVDRVGKGMRGSPRDALIADEVTADIRGAAFGFHRMMDTAGAFLGVMISGTILYILKDHSASIVYRVIFSIAALIAFLSFGVTLFLKENKAQPQLIQQEKNYTAQPSLKELFKSLGSSYWITLLILSLFSFANSSDVFLLLRASDIGLSAIEVVCAYALYNFVYTIGSYPAGKASDRFGRWKVIVVGWLIYSAVYAGFAVSTTSTIWFLFAFYGLYMALTDGVTKALIVDCITPMNRGTALGILYFILGLTTLSSNILAGYMWDHLGKSSPFWIGSMSALVASFVALLFFMKKRTTQRGL